jgi:hypothetical protein
MTFPLMTEMTMEATGPHSFQIALDTRVYIVWDAKQYRWLTVGGPQESEESGVIYGIRLNRDDNDALLPFERRKW